MNPRNKASSATQTKNRLFKIQIHPSAGNLGSKRTYSRINDKGIRTAISTANVESDLPITSDPTANSLGFTKNNSKKIPTSVLSKFKYIVNGAESGANWTLR